MTLVLRQPLWQRIVCSLPLILLAGVLFGGGVQERENRLWAWAGGVVVVLVVGRSWFLRVEASPSGVLLVNWLTRRRVAWAEVRRVSYDQQLLIELRNGSPLGSAAFPYVPGSWEIGLVPGRRAAAQLQAMRKRRRDAGRR